MSPVPRRSRTARPAGPSAARGTPATTTLAAAVVAAGALLAAGCTSGGGDPGARTSSTPSAGASSQASRPPRDRAQPSLLYDGSPIFGPTSFWNQQVVDAPVSPDSPAIVEDLVRQVREENDGNASFNVWKYNATIVTVGADQKRVDVGFDDCQHKGHTPRGLLGPGGQFTGVPLPSDITTNGGTDSSLGLWSPETHELWEFWKLKRGATGWTACWGGHIPDTRTSPGYFEGGFGTTATGLAGVAGAVHLQDVRAGSIDHALTIAVRDPAPWKRISWPAQRSDGSSKSDSPVREGQRFRLDPAVDVDSLHLDPLAAMIAKAAQRYGLVVSDRAGTVSIGGEGGREEEAVTGRNPWRDILGDRKSYALLKGFPWDRLQALPLDYGEPAGTD